MNARQDKWVRLGKSEKKRREGRGFPRAGRAAPRDFPRAKPVGNPLLLGLTHFQLPCVFPITGVSIQYIINLL